MGFGADFLSVVNGLAMNISGIHLSISLFFSPLDMYLGVELLGLVVILCLVF